MTFSESITGLSSLHLSSTVVQRTAAGASHHRDQRHVIDSGLARIQASRGFLPAKAVEAGTVGQHNDRWQQ
jgi:hypothetical protein